MMVFHLFRNRFHAGSTKRAVVRARIMFSRCEKHGSLILNVVLILCGLPKRLFYRLATPGYERKASKVCEVTAGEGQCCGLDQLRRAFGWHEPVTILQFCRVCLCVCLKNVTFLFGIRVPPKDIFEVTSHPARLILHNPRHDGVIRFIHSVKRGMFPQNGVGHNLKMFCGHWACLPHIPPYYSRKP